MNEGKPTRGIGKDYMMSDVMVNIKNYRPTIRYGQL